MFYLTSRASKMHVSLFPQYFQFWHFSVKLLVI